MTKGYLRLFIVHHIVFFRLPFLIFNSNLPMVDCQLWIVDAGVPDNKFVEDKKNVNSRRFEKERKKTNRCYFEYVCRMLYAIQPKQLFQKKNMKQLNELR